MIGLDNNEAILFRLLSSFFGRERVIPQMSVLAACSGELPTDKFRDQFAHKFEGKDRKAISLWAKQSKCLFTVVNELDAPKLVVELGVDAKTSIDVAELEKQDQARPILKAAGVAYIVLSKSDLTFITDPQAPANWFHLLQSKFEEASADLAA